ncbi:MAG: metallophosphoesterase [Phycisphaerales bacterium]|nr:metallophosphoesterase [Phycisphaerales bacterium]
MPDPFAINLGDADEVIGALRAGADANFAAACRRGSIDVIDPPGTLIATGDLHDNPLHFRRLVQAAGLLEDQEAGRRGNAEAEQAAPAESGAAASLGRAVPSHLLLHEIIHSDRLLNGMDFSYRALARVAALKAAHPTLVHTLLANHELSQMSGAGIVKDGVRVVEAFSEGVAHTFGDRAGDVGDAIRAFVRSMPLALRARTPRGDILCSHSLPAPWAMQRFDATVLSRDLTDADYEPRQGAAHLMVWGREYDAGQMEDLVERWGVTMFVLGHEHVDEGVRFVPPCAVILNSDHERGVYLPIDLSHPPRAAEAPSLAVRLGA